MTKKVLNQKKIDLKKYSKTYRLLGEYDKEHIKNPEILADAGRLRELIDGLQNSPKS